MGNLFSKKGMGTGGRTDGATVGVSVPRMLCAAVGVSVSTSFSGMVVVGENVTMASEGADGATVCRRRTDGASVVAVNELLFLSAVIVLLEELEFEELELFFVPSATPKPTATSTAITTKTTNEAM